MATPTFVDGKDSLQGTVKPQTLSFSLSTGNKRAKDVVGTSLTSSPIHKRAKPDTKSASGIRVVSIEGNIGSGKSTLVQHLRKHFAPNPRICFLDEPVSIWNTIRDEKGTTILEKYYGNQEKYAFPFQMMAYISRLSLLKKALKGDYDVIVTERSVFTDSNIFAKMLYDDKKIEEVAYQIYNKWWHEFLQEIPPVWLIYVKTDPEIAKGRVTKRAREGEDIPLAYLENCHKYHEAWMNKKQEVPTLVLDANIDICKQPNELKKWIGKIDTFINTEE